MPIIDAQNQYASALTLTSTAALTNVIDHGSDRNIGIGEPLAAVFSVTAIDAADGDETYVVTLETDSVVGFGSAVTVGSVAVTLNTAVPARFVIVVPPDLTMNRFSRLKATLGGTTPSITIADADLRPMSDIQNFVAYAVGTHIQ